MFIVNDDDDDDDDYYYYYYKFCWFLRVSFLKTCIQIVQTNA